MKVYGRELFRISPGLNNIVPLRYAYSLGVRSSLQSCSKHDLRFCTAARFDGPCSVSSFWSWSRILRRKLVVGKSATSSITRSCARPRTNSWTQWPLRSKNWSKPGRWWKEVRLLMKHMVFSNTWLAALQVLSGFFKHTNRRCSQWQLCVRELQSSSPRAQLSVRLRMLNRMVWECSSLIFLK